MSTLEEKRGNHQKAIILQQQGLFFNAYDEDALILCEITGYKAKMTSTNRYKCGFPANSDKTIEKVLGKLDHARLNYYIYKNDELLYFRAKEDEDNEYPEYLNAAKAVIEETEKTDSINKIVIAGNETSKEQDALNQVTVSLTDSVKGKLWGFSMKHPQYTLEAIVNMVLEKGLSNI